MYNDMIAKREAKIKENRQVFQVSILHQLIWCVSVITKKARRYAPYVSADFSVRVTGLEPAHHSALEPKSNVSANFTTPAYKIPPPIITEGDK